MDVGKKKSFELVFPLPEGGKHGVVVMGRWVEAADSYFDGGLSAAQERVDQQFPGDRAWQRGLALVAQADAVCLVGGQIAVAGFHGHRKPQVRQRVFMGATYHRIAGKGSQLVEGREHLRWRTLEKLAAAARKKRVTAKQERLAVDIRVVERDVA